MPSPFRTTPQLGPNLTQQIVAGQVWFDNPDLVSPKVGTRETGDDGHDYVFVRASAAIASATPGTAIIVTEPAMTAATGAGAFQAPAGQAVESGAYFWARKTSI